MKRFFAIIVAMALVGVNPLMIGVAFADTQRGTGVINVIKFIDTNEPDDLSLQIDGVNYSDNIGGYLRHILGTERGNKFLADQNAVYAQYENCESVPKEEYEACHAEADKASAELYLEYLIYPVEIIDIQMMSGGSVFESGVAYADLSIYLEKVQREYDIVLSVANSMDYDISLEPLVVRKIKDEAYDDIKARYDNSTNELRFGTEGLSECMVGFRLIENNDNNNDDDDDDDDDDESFQDRLASADNLPTDTKLVIRSLKDLDESEMMMLVYGEDVNSKFEAINEKLEEAEGDEDEFYQIIADLYDDIGILAFFEADRDLLDIFLANANTGEKVPYNGNGITIRYKFDADFDEMAEDGLEEFYNYSSRKWSPAVVHVKDDGSREYLPATITDGVWEFTTDSFSTFFPALVADLKVESPNTLDSNYVNIGVALISVASLFTLGMWIAKKERR